MRRAFLAILVAAASAVVMGGAAAGHAVYVKSTPGSDARLTKPPAEIRITFSETPEARGSAIEVLDVAGKRMDQGDVGRTEDPSTLRVSVNPIGEGGYLVNWTVLSAVDGHETKGAFGFAVGDAPLPKIPDIGPATAPPGPGELAGRVLSFAGIALVVGVAFFGRFINVFALAGDARHRWILAAGGALLVLGALLLLAQQGANTPFRLAALLGLRAFAGAIAVGATWLPRQIVPVVRRRELQLVAGLGAALTATLVSHAAASGALTQMALDLVHVIAISVWSGGVVALLAVALRPRTKKDEAKLGALVWRFSLVALVCVAVLISTGVLQALGRLVLLEDLYETPYGIALLAKVLLLVALLAVGALNLFRFGPRMRRGMLAGAGLTRSMLGETAAFACVLLASSFLTALPPPASASGAAFETTQRVSGIRIALLAAQSTPGRNRYVVRVQEGLQPISGAERVALRFTMVEHDMGEQELIATERAPGEYVAEGSPTAMFGTWKVRTVVRITGRPDVSALFTMPVAAAAGQGATSKVVAIPPLTLIVFSEPTQPQAGAPITINIVMVDPKGDPVTGRSVQAAFNGPVPQAPIEALEAGAAGPGRYGITIPALEAGAWKVTITIAGIGSGVIDLNVSR